MPLRMLIPLIVACGLFMENLNSTVLATSLPAIAADLHVAPISLKLALTSYLLSLAVFIPISGWAADKFGARTVFMGAIAVFSGGSLLCSLAHSLPEFVLYRIVQGLGGAMMVPVGRLVILRSVTKSEMISALAWLTIPALLGPVLGTAARRLHHDLPALALDLLHQPAHRRAGARADLEIHRQHQGARCAAARHEGLRAVRPGPVRLRLGLGGPRRKRGLAIRGACLGGGGPWPSARPTSGTPGAPKTR